MKQVFQRAMRNGFRAPQARTFLMSTAITGSAYFMYQQNKRVELPMMSLGVQADCAPMIYQVPDQIRVQECKADLMEFCSKRRNMAPLLVRLSWHDAGTYD